MERLLRRLIPSLGQSLDKHLNDNQLVSLFGRELSFGQRVIARRHLAHCWQCRVRQEDLEGRRSEQVMEDYREAIKSNRLALPKEPRAELAQWLQVHMQPADLAGVRAEARAKTQERRWSFRLPKISLPELPTMNPALATCMVLGLATTISFFVWWQQRLPNITSNALLVRAEKWDRSSLSTGVVYQAVRITTPTHSMDRNIYRDPQGKRQPKRVSLTGKDEQLKSALLQAGVDWDEPISASGYQEWHDHQHVREDRITRAGAHLLRLTTEVPDGSVAEQSLTVRDTDFHPVRRTIAFRDNETVEIAELDFKILPWNAVDASVFEPIGSIDMAGISSPSRGLVLPALPERLTEDQLDETELSARLVLNNLHADTGEQIEIARTVQGVEVKGLVETNERKRALQTQLAMVPHLTVSIQSVTDLRNHPELGDKVSSIKTASVMDLQSPLETYLHAHGRNVREISLLEQRLFDNALAISQESKAIDDLQARFVASDQMPALTVAKLSELIYNHHERLQAALKQERALLGEVQAASHGGNGARSLPPLLDTAIRNLTLCKELTLANSPNPRSAEKILAEMSVLLDDLTADAHQAYGKPQSEITMGRKK
jgi:hypothetical protein